MIRGLQPVLLVYDTNFREYDLSNLLISVTINKSTEVIVPTMQVTLVPSLEGKLTTITQNRIIAEIKKKVKLNSVISLKMDSSFKKHSFLGFIDHVYESIVSQNNSTSRALVLNCSMMLPKMLLRDTIVNSPALATNAKIKSELGDRVEFFDWMRGMENGKSPFAGTPEDAVKWILDNIPATNTNMGDNNNPKRFFNPKIKDIYGKSVLDFHFLEGELLFDKSLSVFSGPIIKYIYSAIDRPFYEVFFDTTTGEDGLPYNTMVIRPKPYSYKDYKQPFESKALSNWYYWEDLHTVEISSEERITENLGINDYELKNFFSLNFVNSLIASASSNLGKFGIQFPVVNLESIKRYGLRALYRQSTLIDYDKIKEEYNTAIKNYVDGKGHIKSIDELLRNVRYKKEGSSHLAYLFEKREKLVEWHAFPFYESGQIKVIGDEKHKLGSKLVYTDKQYYDMENDEVHTGVEYYVRGITEHFRYGSFYTQTLRLVHGAPEGLPVKWLNEKRPDFISIDKIETNKTEPVNTVLDDSETIKKRQERIANIKKTPKIIS